MAPLPGAYSINTRSIGSAKAMGKVPARELADANEYPFRINPTSQKRWRTEGLEVTLHGMIPLLQGIHSRSGPKGPPP